MGTFSSDSLRRCAVTTISWMLSESVALVLVSVAVAAWEIPAPMPEPLKIAAIA